MDSDRFDALTRDLAQIPSRRTVLRGLGGLALSAFGLAGRSSGAGAAPGGNSACADFCHALFGDTRAAGECVRDAAHGTGLCIACNANPVGCVPCQASADCPTGLVCDATAHVCRGCTSRSECAPLDQAGNRFCEPLFDGSDLSVCTNPNACGCPGTCADCGTGSVCIHTGGIGGICQDKNLCCPPTPAL